MLIWHLHYVGASPRSDGIPATQRSTLMSTEHIETAIIGAGQAGLATAYHLQRRGRPCLVLDANQRVGDNWRAHWDSLRLYSPAGYDGLPGLPFPGTALVLPDQGRRRRLSGRLRRPVRRFRCARACGSTGWRPSTAATRCGSAPTPCWPRTWSWPPGTFGRTPNIPEFALELDPVDPAAALQRVPPAGPAAAGPGAGRRRIALRHRHRLRAGAQPSDGAGRAGPRAAAGPAGPLERPGVLADLRVPRPSTCSPAGPRSAARRWTRSGSTAAR